ncbi:MAG: NADH:flavin oxidoreductase/NADH oxidase [Proteobacteria bacterium]|nr:NADH:flavin oxidoreductase/NADH oxidase [Pseudomonadota bacterium]
MPSQLFSPITLRGLTLRNRIVIAPMCQYSASDGNANEWHLIHLGHMALSGAGLLMIEATGVQPEGRITSRCLGLYSDGNEAALAKIIAAIRERSGIAFGIQIAHAGRKGSVHVPWEGGRPLSNQEGAWKTVAPSALRFGESSPEPHALGAAEMDALCDAFVETAERAARIGFDLIEVHAAHGYLLHEFLSPIANRRSDDYGGSPENRMRFPLEVVASVRQVWPDDRPLGLRITGSDGVDGGLTADDADHFARKLHELGCDYVCVSSGGIAPGAHLESGPGYNVPTAAKIKSETDIAVRVVGHILDAQQAEDIIATGQADMVAMARALLDNPRWPWHAALNLGAHIEYPAPYARSHPDLWPGAKLLRSELEPGAKSG